MLPVSTDIARRSLMTTLSASEATRFSRQLLLPEIGPEGQKKLKATRILVIGAGGLGSPASLYLAAAGVGTLGLVEFDQVDKTNLQRQILYSDADTGRNKVEAARDRLLALAPDLCLRSHHTRLDAKNAITLIEPYDIVIDGSDNFSTRYLVNDACVLLQKPYVYGSIYRFEGQTSVFYAPHGPCYRCLFPSPPSPGQIPSCAEGGVLGVLPGQIGLIQATEALKLALGIGHTLLGRLLIFDALSLRFDEFKVSRNANCAACGNEPNVNRLDDSIDSCGELEPQATGTPPVQIISPQDYLSLLQAATPHQLLDVRSKNEAAICSIAGSILLPFTELSQRVHEIAREKPVIIYCKSGSRSMRAAALLRDLGFSNACSLAGGILAWIDTCEPDLPKY